MMGISLGCLSIHESNWSGSVLLKRRSDGERDDSDSKTRRWSNGVHFESHRSSGVRLEEIADELTESGRYLKWLLTFIRVTMPESNPTAGELGESGN
jgi:hypothetical protein